MKQSFRLVKVKAGDNCTREFLVKAKAIVEDLVNGQVVHASPISNLEQLWDCLNTEDNLLIEVEEDV